MERARCPWALGNREMTEYHDTEWGRPLVDDKKILQAFFLDTFQAGLSWAIILSKKNNFKKAFANFNPVKIAGFNRGEVRRLMGNSGIIRNRRKIEAAIQNAQKILDIKKEYGSFAKYLWQFTKGKTMHHAYRRIEEVPTTSKEAKNLSKDMRARGFKFVGPTTIYAFMQGIGMVNDHLVSCFAHQEVKKASSRRF
ncbi:MAG: 3-methyladenine DNA glycosylase [Candidatus Wildermuthbacteria bacterium RIFCSPHIGHO2_02_FULL_47_12]|uniref:3-methyladenine DNA glycosylase n=1 Tax=Candidatus Wildermuthbacteria bacterium RIFCSPHIGHO2_02_FULL_47_12 TaxID=1802451 RepID=A0A1G2R1W2_9BACT|nr:MAG: 3-methyladenine DNA glycosylase [Candidatus Wildermuthbacteria bacterium RIFCSPHIGHO2_02_FULL_47_12]